MKLAEENLDDKIDDELLVSQDSYLGLGNIVVFKGFASFKSRLLIENISCCAQKFKKNRRNNLMFLDSCLNRFIARLGLSL